MFLLNFLTFWSKIILRVHKEDEPMNDLIGNVKKVAQGIVKTVKKISKAVKFFMTQIRNGCGSNYIGFNSCCNSVDNGKNC